VTRTCKEWPLAYEPKHKTFKTMPTLNVETIKLIGNGVLDAKHVAVLLQADMLTEEAAVDALQMNRVCAIMTDAQKEALTKKQSQLTARRKVAIEELMVKHPYLRKTIKRVLKVKR